MGACINFKQKKITITFNYQNNDHTKKDKFFSKESSLFYKFRQTRNTTKNCNLLSNNNLKLNNSFKPDSILNINMNLLQDEESIQSFNSSQITFEDEEGKENSNIIKIKKMSNTKTYKNYFESIPEKVFFKLFNFLEPVELQEINKINKRFKILTKKYCE